MNEDSVVFVLVQFARLLISLFLVGVVVFIRRFGRDNTVFFSIFCSVFFVVHLLIPAVQDIFPVTLRFAPASVSLSVNSVFVSFSFIAVFVFVYFSLYRSNIRVWALNQCLTGGRRDFFVFFVLPSLAAVYILNLVFSVGVGAYLVNRIELLRGAGWIFLLVNFYIFYGLRLFVQYSSCSANKKVYFVLFVGFSVFVFVLFSFLGSRNSGFVYILVIFVSAYLLGFKLGFSKFVLYGVVFFVVFSIVGFFRIRFDSVDQFGSHDILWVSSLISVFGVDEVGRFLVDRGFSDWQYGKTFLAALTNFVPRDIWPDKPLGAGPLVTNVINPGGYEIGRDNISSYTTGIVWESYLNFGIFGAPVLAAVLAVVGIFVDRIKPIGFYWLSIKVYCIAMFAFAVFYSEFLGLFARAVFVLFPVLLLVSFYPDGEKVRR